MTEFKPGDRVLVTNHEHETWNGHKGTVIELAHDNSIVRVQIDGVHTLEQDYCPFFPSEIELLPKFKIGDRVKMVANDGPLSPRKGQYATIIEKSETWAWKVSFSDGNQACVHEQEIELSDEPLFEVGNYARVIEQGTNNGRLGLVREIRPSGVVIDFGLNFPIDYFSFEDVETADAPFLRFEPIADITDDDVKVLGKITIPKVAFKPVDHTHKIGDVWNFVCDTDRAYKTTTYVYVGKGRFYNVTAGHETTTSYLASFDHEGWQKIR